MCTDLRPIEEIYTDDYVARSTMPRDLADCLYLAKYENGRYVHDAVRRVDADLIDQWLCEIEHPLAFQPGTQESRIVSLVREFGGEPENDL